MPIYEYKCERGHIFEVMQRMSDDPVQTCETCESPVARVFHPVAVHFKGSGFYNTDYGTRKRARESSSSDGGKSDSSSSSSDSKPSSSETKSSSSESKSSSDTKTTTSTTKSD